MADSVDVGQLRGVTDEVLPLMFTSAGADAALANVAEGFCPFGHGPLRHDPVARAGICAGCSELAGRPYGFWTVADPRGLAWASTDSYPGLPVGLVRPQGDR